MCLSLSLTHMCTYTNARTCAHTHTHTHTHTHPYSWLWPKNYLALILLIHLWPKASPVVIVSFLLFLLVLLLDGFYFKLHLIPRYGIHCGMYCLMIFIVMRSRTGFGGWSFCCFFIIFLMKRKLNDQVVLYSDQINCLPHKGRGAGGAGTANHMTIKSNGHHCLNILWCFSHLAED